MNPRQHNLVPSDAPVGTPGAPHSRAACLVLATVFLVLILVPAVFHVAFGLRASDVRRWRGWLAERPAAEALREIDTDFDRRFLLSFVARALTDKVPAFVPRTAAAAQTVPGTGGFLFLNRDNLVCTSAGFLHPGFPRPAGAVEQLIDLDRQLKARGIHLLVLPVPPKLSIYPDRLDPKYDASAGPFVNVDHGRWFDRLRAAGVDAVDLTPLLWSHRDDPRGLMYYATDSHWTDLAKRLAAAGPVAEHLRSVVADLPRARPFHARPATRTFTGNLVLIGNARRATPRYRDDQVREEVVQLTDDDGAAVIPGDEAQVLVIGDSTADQVVSAGYGFSQRVMEVLGVPVRSAAVSGADGNGARQVLVTQPHLLRGKRVVIFCFSLHHVVLHDWLPIRLPGP